MNAQIAKLVGGRLVVAALTLVFVAVVVFVATQLLPGDVAQAILGQSATPEAVAGLRTALGLDQPALQRFLHWLGGSLVSRQPIGPLIGTRLASSLLLAAIVAAVAVPLALAIGITSAVWRGSLYDRVVATATISVVAVPEFLVATVAVLIFAVHLHWLPALSFVPAHALSLIHI